MKKLRSILLSKTGKLLLVSIVAISVISGIFLLVCKGVNKKIFSEQKEAAGEAEAAGYDESFFVCERKENLTLNGISYIHFDEDRSSFVDGSIHKDLLMEEKAGYKDDTGGKTKDLIIYGRVKEEVLSGDVKYKVIEPYKIAVYKPGIDMWAVGGIMALAVMVQIVLATVLVVYVIASFSKKTGQ